MLFLITFYLFLLGSTGLIFLNALKMWRLNRDLTLPISTFFIYYFTLGGAIFFPIDAFLGFKGAEIGLHYLPMFDRLFKVSFDFNYLNACLLYVFFILIFQFTYLILMKKKQHLGDALNLNEKHIPFKLSINTNYIMLMSLFFIFISIYVLRKELFYAIANEKSIYIITRANTNPYYTIHQLANEFAIIIPFIAYSFTILKNNKYNININKKKLSFVILFLCCSISSIYIAMLGNRREILSGLVICLLISLNEFKNINYKKLGAIVLLVFSIFLMNNFFRSTSIPKLINNLAHPSYDQGLSLKKENNNNQESGVAKSKHALGSFFLSNELFYAHFSMYGVLEKKVPITHGSSLIYLFSSIIPRSVYAKRPPDIYSYYAKSVNAAPGQIYTIHHATAWYLNFGILGIFIGAILLALLFVFSFRIKFLNLKYQNKFIIFLKFLMPYLICSQIVTFITAGPEAYKAMIVEGVILPILLIAFCTRKEIH